MSNLPCAFNGAYNQIACAFGQLFNIYRPNFNQVDQTPTFLSTQPLFVKPGVTRFAIPNLSGVNYFTITGDRFNFLPGDILIPVNSTSEIPILTILNYDNGLPCIGFRTSRKCNIVYTINSGDNVYTNVYCDFISFTTPESGIIDELSGALKVANTKIVVWTRSQIEPQNNVNLTFGTTSDIAGMRIVFTDGVTPIRYVVRSLTQIGSISVFNCDFELT